MAKLTAREIAERELELRLSVSSHRLHYDGLASLTHSRDEIDRMNIEYDHAMREIEMLYD